MAPSALPHVSSRGITRNRERLACEPCRRRKLRCDRSQPCGACTRRSEGSGCSYQRFAPGRGSSDASAGAATGAEAVEGRRRMETRLGLLETMIQQLVTTQGHGNGEDGSGSGSGSSSNGNGRGNSSGASEIHSTEVSPTKDSSSVQNQPGMIAPPEKATGPNGSKDTSVPFHGATHWSAVLNDIHEMRLAMSTDEIDDHSGEDDIAEEEPFTPYDPQDRGIGILLGAPNQPGNAETSFEAILATHLPPRQDVDRLTATYFRAVSIAAPFVHAKQFQRLYASFWEDPLAASPLWTSLLFSICHIATNSLKPKREICSAPRGETRHNRFSVAAAKCLAVGQYYRTQRFAVEGLLLFLHAQCLTSKIMVPDVAPLLGILMRMASMGGYHDEARVARLPPFEQEMRRRVWSLCMQLDLLISFHLGVPSTVQFTALTTRPPRCLKEMGFDEDARWVPAEETDPELSPMIFIVAKHNFMMIFDKVLRHALAVPDSDNIMTKLNANPNLHINNVTVPDIAELHSLDAEVRQLFNSLPPVFQPKPMADSVFDSAKVIVTRICLLFLHCKCLCVLHRPYMLRGRTESLLVCHSASSDLVHSFCNAYVEFAAGGQVETEGWFMSSLTWHDFLLGAVSLCLSALVGLQNLRSTGSAVLSLADLQNTAMLLREAMAVGTEQQPDREQETGRVLALVKSTLAKLESSAPFAAASSGEQSLPGPSGTSVDSAMSMSMSLPNNGPQISGNDGVWDMQDHLADFANDSLWDRYLEQYLEMDDSLPPVNP